MTASECIQFAVDHDLPVPPGTYDIQETISIASTGRLRSAARADCLSEYAAKRARFVAQLAAIDELTKLAGDR